jgi:hypothetical protein
MEDFIRYNPEFLISQPLLPIEGAKVGKVEFSKHNDVYAG